MSLASQRAVLLRGDPGLFDILKRGASFVARKAFTTFAPGPVQLITSFAQGGGRRPGIALPAPPAGLAFPRGSGAAAQAAGAPSAGCAKGFHVNKSSYFTKAGFVEMGTKCVKNRRRNLSNGRANTRSLRRMTAWEKQDKKRRQTLAAIARSAK